MMPINTCRLRDTKVYGLRFGDDGSGGGSGGLRSSVVRKGRLRDQPRSGRGLEVARREFGSSEGSISCGGGHVNRDRCGRVDRRRGVQDRYNHTTSDVPNSIDLTIMGFIIIFFPILSVSNTTVR